MSQIIPQRAVLPLRELPCDFDLGTEQIMARAQEVLLGKPALPVLVGPYELEKQLTADASGVVFLARRTSRDGAHDAKSRQKVAIRLLSSASHDYIHRTPDDALAELHQLAQLGTSLRAANIVPVERCGLFRGQAYVAMENIEGTSLLAWQQAERRPVVEILERYIQAANGLAYAHEHRISRFATMRALLVELERAKLEEGGGASPVSLSRGRVWLNNFLSLTMGVAVASPAAFGLSDYLRIPVQPGLGAELSEWSERAASWPTELLPGQICSATASSSEACVEARQFAGLDADALAAVKARTPGATRRAALTCVGAHQRLRYVWWDMSAGGAWLSNYEQRQLAALVGSPRDCLDARGDVATGTARHHIALAWIDGYTRGYFAALEEGETARKLGERTNDSHATALAYLQLGRLKYDYHRDPGDTDDDLRAAAKDAARLTPRDLDLERNLWLLASKNASLRLKDGRRAERYDRVGMAVPDADPFWSLLWADARSHGLAVEGRKAEAIELRREALRATGWPNDSADYLSELHAVYVNHSQELIEGFRETREMDLLAEAGKVLRMASAIEPGSGRGGRQELDRLREEAILADAQGHPDKARRIRESGLVLAGPLGVLADNDMFELLFELVDADRMRDTPCDGRIARAREAMDVADHLDLQQQARAAQLLATNLTECKQPEAALEVIAQALDDLGGLEDVSAENQATLLKLKASALYEYLPTLPDREENEATRLMLIEQGLDVVDEALRLVEEMPPGTRNAAAGPLWYRRGEFLLDAERCEEAELALTRAVELVSLPAHMGALAEARNCNISHTEQR